MTGPLRFVTSSGVLWLLASAAVAQAPADSTAAATPTGLASAWQFAEELFGLATGDLRARFLRIGVILAIVVIARAIVFLVLRLSHFVVYAEWGPLRYLFRDHQRSITLHNLLISITKYVVYFLALGYILRELGVNYTTYLASLSLVGIAIGFGSQGLVQDVVTGFFILFENQYSVGDMVEVSGQVGVVEAIGLRTSRIRTYLGSSAVLQNRNIPMAVRYPTGGVEALVDISVESAETATAASTVAAQVGAELARQFDEVLLDTPFVEQTLPLATGETFVRLRARIWPAQQWVVEAQLVPRLREAMGRAGLAIPGDRIVAFYHVRTEPVRRD